MVKTFMVHTNLDIELEVKTLVYVKGMDKKIERATKRTLRLLFWDIEE